MDTDVCGPSSSADAKAAIASWWVGISLASVGSILDRAKCQVRRPRTGVRAKCILEICNCWQQTDILSKVSMVASNGDVPSRR